MQCDPVGHRAFEPGDLSADDIVVVDEQRRAAGLGDKLLGGIAADQQLAISRRQKNEAGSVRSASLRSPPATPLFGGDRLIFLRREIFLGVERGHAAGAGGGDRLAVDFVHHVAAGEHALDAGPRRARLDPDIAVAIEVELALEQLGRRLVADGDERAFDLDPADLARALVADVEADQRLGLAAADELDDFAVPDDLDVGIGEQPVLQDLLGAEANRGGGSG